jgi:hypothetical protein
VVYEISRKIYFECREINLFSLQNYPRFRNQRLQAQGGGDGLQGLRLQGDFLQKNNVRVEVTVEAGQAG